MSSTPVADPLSETVHWRDEPHHITLLDTPQYTVLVGDLPPHDRTLLHGHYNPSVCVSLVAASGIIDLVLSDPVRAKQPPKSVSFPKGILVDYNCTQENPHIHQYFSTDCRSLFLAIESPLARVSGAATPPLSVDVPPQVTVRHALEDRTFTSAATITVPKGSSVGIHVNPADRDKLLARLLVRLDGPPLRLLDVRTPADVVVEYLQYDKCDPPAQAYVFSRFSSRSLADERTTVTNTISDTAELVIIDYFAAEYAPIGQ